MVPRKRQFLRTVGAKSRGLVPSPRRRLALLSGRRLWQEAGVGTRTGRSIGRWSAAAVLLAGAGAATGRGEAPARTLAFTAQEGTWLQPDVSPDGRRIVFDLLGDIYALPMEGGTATPLLTGPAFETHPAISPDGRHIAFVSDRSGTINLWVADGDGGNPRQVSRETSLNVMAQPAWSADGRRIFVSRLVHSLLGFELFAYPLAGGPGEKVTSAQPNGDDGWDRRYNVLGAVPDGDGAILYAARRGDTFTPSDPKDWSIVRRTLAGGAEETLVSGTGGAMAPALSHDGRLLAYGTREDGATVLRLRTLATGEDRRLGPLDHDGQEGGYYGGVLPRFRFLPGDRALLVSRGGRLERMAVADGAATPIPFAAPVRLAIAPAPRPDVPVEDGPVRVRVVQNPALAPDGATLAFTALGRLYRQSGTATPRPLAAAGDDAYQPNWSPDGRRIAYVRWSARDAGAVWTIGADGRAARRLTRTFAYYTEPAFAPDGRTVAALRASHHDRMAAVAEIAPDRPTAIVLIDPATGAERVVARTPGARLLRWSADGRALEFYGPGGVQTLDVASGAVRTVARVVGLAPSQYVGAAAAVDEAMLAPGRRALLIRHAAQLWLAPLPADGATVDLTRPGPGVRRLTATGADFAGWTGEGGLLWSVGSTARLLPAAALDATDPEARATRRDLAVTLPRPVPTGHLLLAGATVLTMRGDEAIARGDILLAGNRIAAVGPAGSLAVPPGTRRLDLTGKTVIPGLIDAHAHFAPIRRRTHQPGHWTFALNLAFGVTAALDVQPFTSDIFAYQDMIDAGMMRGPRAFSTGPGLFRNSPQEPAALAATLARYRDHYRTPNLKAYMVGDRAQRRRVADAARAAGMIATTEGASDLPLGLTHLIDGFAGQEHTLPVTPLRDDLIRLLVATRTSYTPVFAALYGGASLTDAMLARDAWRDDPRIRALLPAPMLATLNQGRRFVSDPAQSYARFAADALAVQRAGGLVAMGSHGEVQGLGLHWELAAYVAGGATPLEALAAATIGSAEAIGRKASLGSIEPGKLADLVVLDADPRAAIANTRRIAWVVKDGRPLSAAELLRR